MIALHMQPSDYYTSHEPKLGFETLRHTLVAMGAFPTTVVQHLDAYTKQAFGAVHTIGHTSLGWGYGELRSLVMKRDSVILLDGDNAVRLKEGSVIERNDNGLFVNRTRVGSAESIPSLIEGSYSITLVETNPGW